MNYILLSIIVDFYHSWPSRVHGQKVEVEREGKGTGRVGVGMAQLYDFTSEQITVTMSILANIVCTTYY